MKLLKNYSMLVVDPILKNIYIWELHIKLTSNIINILQYRKPNITLICNHTLKMSQ